MEVVNREGTSGKIKTKRDRSSGIPTPLERKELLGPRGKEGGATSELCNGGRTTSEKKNTDYSYREG